MRFSIFSINKRPLLLLTAIAMAAVVLSVHPVVAHAANSVNDAKQGAGLTGTGGSGTDLGNVVKAIINVISAIVGVAAVIMIVVGGFRYITSGGDSNNVAGAKNTIIYAIVGLIIVALAQLIVHLVIQQSSDAISGGAVVLYKHFAL